MNRKSNPELIDKENPEWTDENLQRGRQASEVMADLFGRQVFAKTVKPRGRPKVSVAKIHLNIRLDPDVLEAFKATGRGWQTRINKALREWIKEKKVGKNTARLKHREL